MENSTNSNRGIKQIFTTKVKIEYFAIASVVMVMLLTNPHKDEAVDYLYGEISSKSIDYRGVCRTPRSDRAECYYRVEKISKNESRIKSLIDSNSKHLNIFIANFTWLPNANSLGGSLRSASEKEITIENDFSEYYSSYTTQYPGDFEPSKGLNGGIDTDKGGGPGGIVIGVLGREFGFAQQVRY